MKIELTDEQVTLLRECVRFSVWAAGEGICPVEGQPATEPEMFLFDYASATGDEDYDTYADRILPEAPQPVAKEAREDE